MTIACRTCVSCCCCKLEPAVLVRSDIPPIAAATGLKEADFVENRAGEVPLLRFNPVRGCLFLDEKSGKCGIYPVRPLDCRLFPLDIISSDARYFLIRYRTNTCALDDVPSEELIRTAEEEVFPRLWAEPREFSRFARYENPAGPFTHFPYEILKEINVPAALP
jgi:Fe-S-cluster containining protein